MFWLEICSLKNLFSVDIRPIFVNFGDYVGIYNVYSENSAQKHFFEFKKIIKKYQGVQIKIIDTRF